MGRGKGRGKGEKDMRIGWGRVETRASQDQRFPELLQGQVLGTSQTGKCRRTDGWTDTLRDEKSQAGGRELGNSGRFIVCNKRGMLCRSISVTQYGYWCPELSKSCPERMAPPASQNLRC